MKITEVEVLRVDHYVFARVHTEAGISGLGEAGAWGALAAAESTLHAFREYLVGKDARQIEHHWNVLYRNNHFRGAGIMGAISAIDVALWDIKGKALGVPIYELLGGQVRHKARVYYHVKAPTVDEQVDLCLAARARGFTAVGHINPFQDEGRHVPYFRTHAAKIGGAVEAVRRFRDAVGDSVDLCLEIHRRLTPAEAVVLAQGIARYHPYFYEDPITPQNVDSMAGVTAACRQVGVPVATGERFHSPFEFQALLARSGAQFVRPSIGVVGGITGMRKVAALAELHDVLVVPHNPESTSPVCTAACLQVVAAIPNFGIQEYPVEDVAPQTDIVRWAATGTGVPRLEAGYLFVPDAPGLGIVLADGAAERFPFKSRPIRMRQHVDGSPVDQ